MVKAQHGERFLRVLATKHSVFPESCVLDSVVVEVGGHNVNGLLGVCIYL